MCGVVRDNVSVRGQSVDDAQDEWREVCWSVGVCRGGRGRDSSRWRSNTEPKTAAGLRVSSA